MSETGTSRRRLGFGGQAAGAFPRPDLHERLERVLGKTKPDLVIACSRPIYLHPAVG